MVTAEAKTRNFHVYQRTEDKVIGKKKAGLKPASRQSTNRLLTVHFRLDQVANSTGRGSLVLLLECFNSLFLVFDILGFD